MRTLIRVKQVKITILILGLFLISSPSYSQNQSSDDTSKFIEIDGYKYHYNLGGQEHLNKNKAVIILELGAASPLDAWQPIFSELSKMAPVLAYERSGQGQSDWNKSEPTPLNSVILLRKILKKLKLPSPYVLVGHSWGGVIIRTYAGHYSDEVKALVYIDPTDFTSTLDDLNSVYAEIGVNPVKANKFFDDVEAFYSQNMQMPPGVKAEIDYAVNYTKLKIGDRNLGINPNLPLVVFVATKYTVPPPPPQGLEEPFIIEDWFKISTKQRIVSLSKLISESPEGYFIVSPKAGHNFHFGEPNLVIDMIIRFIEKKE